MARKFEVVKGCDPKEILLPSRASSASAGYDFRSREEATILPGETKILFTGVKAQMPRNEVLLLAIRSSLGVKRGLSLANGVGVIDADYYGNPNNDGEIGVALFNRGSTPAFIEKGERIAQGIFVPYMTVDEEEATEKRLGGFGSSGKN